MEIWGFRCPKSTDMQMSISSFISGQIFGQLESVSVVIAKSSMAQAFNGNVEAEVVRK